MDNTGFNQVLQYKEYSTSKFRDAASHICASHWTSFYNSALPIRFFCEDASECKAAAVTLGGKKNEGEIIDSHT